MEYPHITQAAIVPYAEKDGVRRYWVLLPVARRPDLPPPEWQLCKGGRENGESLRDNALREGMEELGLSPRLVQSMDDCGDHEFISADGTKKTFTRVFAACLSTAQQGIKGTEPNVAETRWMTLEEFRAHSRPDHLPILEAVDAQLERSQGQER